MLCLLMDSAAENKLLFVGLGNRESNGLLVQVFQSELERLGEFCRQPRTRQSITQGHGFERGGSEQGSNASQNKELQNEERGLVLE